MNPLLEVSNLSKSFGPVQAVRGVSFSVARGELVGFLGPNGAGKTTTMRMIAGFLPADGGTATLGGHDVRTAPVAARRVLGYLPEGAPLYGEMTPAAILAFVAGVRGLPAGERRTRIDDAVDRLGLGPVLQRPIDALSKGFRRRVGLAQAILHDPDILILDEPTDGLDPNQKHEVRNLLRKIARDRAIVISTHILEEVDAICTRAIIIADGAIVADALPSELRQRSPDHNAVSVTFAAAGIDSARRCLAGLKGAASVEDLADGDRITGLRVMSRGGAPLLDEVRGALAAAGLSPDEIHVGEGHLDTVFRDLTRPGGGAP